MANCRICRQPAAIPGLDAVYCTRCGWVESIDRLVELQQQAEQPKQSKPAAGKRRTRKAKEVA